MRTALEKIKEFIQQGLSTKELALAISVGAMAGLFPITGFTTLILLGLAFLFKINAAVTVAFCYLVWPLQLALLIPFIKIGEYFFAEETSNLTLTNVKMAFSDGIGNGFQALGYSLFHGIWAWAVICIPAGILLYHLLKWFIGRLKMGN